jgi:two-component system, chemotaxis family, sensor kinase CheA
VQPDRYKYFRIEAREILEQLGQGALDLEKGAPAPDAVARLLRLAHTLKGAARVVKQPDIAEQAHALEDTLAPYRDNSMPLSRDHVDRLLVIVDTIGRHVAALTPEPAGLERPAAEVPEPSASTGGPVALARPGMDDLDELLNGVLEAHVRLESLKPKLARVGQARHAATLVVDQLGRGTEGAAPGHSSSDKARTIATDLPDLFGRLERDLTANVDQLDRELRQVRETAERLRLSPVSTLFTFLERAVRDVATTLGRPIVFAAAGGDVRVDAVVLGVVQGALQHIVRNAAVHGIEATPAERLAAGKPAEGRITLTVSQHGRLVTLSCTDDGRGIDLEAVRRIAQRRGVLPAGAAAMDADALLRVLLKGGISTSQTVTDVAGRGIGLDVVREAAERLGGSVRVHTDAGRGTTVDLVVPLSIASFAALVIETTEQRLAIPLDAVRSSRRAAREDVVRGDQHESLVIDGDAVPLASLSHLVSGGRLPPGLAPRLSAIVVEGRSGVAAFTVDRIVGIRQVTMRPLPELAPASPIVAGAALDDVGDPMLVCDPDRLVAAARHAGALPAAPTAAVRPVLVVDDSLTTRMLEQSILESAGYTVDVASSGEEALVKARTTPYALLLVDVEMPGMDGFTVIEQLRADASLRHLPAILVTSRAGADDRRRGVEVGAQGYIVKGEFDQGVLLDRIRALVG